MTLPQAPADGRAWREQRCAPREDVVVTDLGDQLVLLDPTNQEMYALDDVGRFIWTALPDSALGGVAQALSEHYGIDAQTAEHDLDDLVRELVEAGVVVVEREGTADA